MIYNI